LGLGAPLSSMFDPKQQETTHEIDGETQQATQ